MKLKKLTLLVVLVAAASVFAQSYNFEEMTMDEYNALLTEWKGRLEIAQRSIAEEDANFTNTQKSCDETQAQIEATWDEIYTAVESSKPEDQEYGKKVQALRSDVSAFMNLSPEEIYRRKDELKSLSDRYNELNGNNLALLSHNGRVLGEVESMLKQAEEKGKPAVPDTYSVVRGDYLWRIAKKPDIYGDPYAWSRIYTSNRDQIKDANLIFPAQIFRIPRSVGPNEHLVMKGEFLSKIAGYSNVYGSAFKWQKLYDANKEVVTDPNVIYPYQVLSVPRN